MTNGRSALYAYDAHTLVNLWNSDQDPGRDAMTSSGKFVVPMIANGKARDFLGISE